MFSVNPPSTRSWPLINIGEYKRGKVNDAFMDSLKFPLSRITLLPVFRSVATAANGILRLLKSFFAWYLELRIYEFIFSLRY